MGQGPGLLHLVLAQHGPGTKGMLRWRGSWGCQVQSHWVSFLLLCPTSPPLHAKGRGLGPYQSLVSHQGRLWGGHGLSPLQRLSVPGWQEPAALFLSAPHPP